MRYTGVSRVFYGPFYVNCIKHYCPNCNELLHKITVSKIVNSRSPEAKDFSFGDTYLVGNVKFIWTEFKCPICGFQTSIRELKRFEKELKRMADEKKPAIKYQYNMNPFYVHWKKHYCPKCNNKLTVKYKSEVINSKSPEAKYYDFSVGDIYIVGDVDFRTSFFHCDKCDFTIPFDEMKKFEKKNS